jgi:hypothetical protein
MVLSRVPPPLVACTPARPGSPVWKASVDVLCRTRQNADRIRGAALAVTGRHPAAVRVGARPYQRIGIVESNRQTHEPLRRNAFYPTAQRLQSRTNLSSYD